MQRRDRDQVLERELRETNWLWKPCQSWRVRASECHTGSEGTVLTWRDVGEDCDTQTESHQIVPHLVSALTYWVALWQQIFDIFNILVN